MCRHYIGTLCKIFLHFLTGTDNHQNHYLSVLIQTTEGNRPIVFLYRLIHLDQVEENAVALKDALKKVLEADGLWDIVKEKLVGLITDGAATMIGRHAGLGRVLEREIGRKIDIKHHCLAHRYDLMTENSMKGFSMFDYFEKGLKSAYSFYHTSHKRQNSLNQFVKEINEPKFRLATIFDVRWISSFRIAVDKVKKHYMALVKHLDFVFDNIQMFVSGNAETIERFENKVQNIKDFLTNKFALSLMHFNYDVIDLFSKESQYTQRKGATLIGMGERKKQLLKNLNDIKEHKGENFKQFLSECSCFRTQLQVNKFLQNKIPKKACADLQAFERSPYVVYKGIVAKDTKLKVPNIDRIELQFGKISAMIGPYVDELVEKVNSYMPDKELSKFDGLDQTLWFKDDSWTTPNLKEVAQMFGVNPRLVQKQFEELIEKLRTEEHWWCENFASAPEFFWAAVLNRQNPGQDLADLIRKILVVPMGMLI